MNRRKRKKRLKKEVDKLMDFTTNYYIPTVLARDPEMAFLCGGYKIVIGENDFSCEPIGDNPLGNYDGSITL